MTTTTTTTTCIYYLTVVTAGEVLFLVDCVCIFISMFIT